MREVGEGVGHCGFKLPVEDNDADEGGEDPVDCAMPDASGVIDDEDDSNGDEIDSEDDSGSDNGSDSGEDEEDIDDSEQEDEGSF